MFMPVKLKKTVILTRERGMSLLMLVLLVLFFVAFYAFQHIYNAQTRARQAHKLFFLNTAMNLSEGAIQLSIQHINREMNDPNANKNKNFWYSSFRKAVNSSNGLNQDLRGLPEVQALAAKFNGKINSLTVSLASVDKFYDRAGTPESFHDIEKCGAVEYDCTAEYMGVNARIRARQDFKVVEARHPIINKYVLFVKDAWNEYSQHNNVGYPPAYKNNPGAFEGFNPADHCFKVNACPDPNLAAGRILLGGPMDTDKKILLNLSDQDTDLMDVIGDSSWTTDSSGNTGFLGDPDTSKTMPANVKQRMKPGELEQVFRSMFYNPDAPMSATDWTDLKAKSTFLFKKKNCGYLPEYSYKRNITNDPSSTKNASDPPASDSAKDLDALKGNDWIFGPHVSNYRLAMDKFYSTINYSAGAPLKWVTPVGSTTSYPVANYVGASLGKNIFDTYSYETKDKSRGLKLFGDAGSRKFTIVEGNVWQRYTTLAALALEIADTPIIKLNFVVPGFYNTIPFDTIKPDDPSKDSAAFVSYLTSAYTGASASASAQSLYIAGAVARSSSANASGVNFNSEVVVRPYNMGRPEICKSGVWLGDKANKEKLLGTIAPPPRGYEELMPLISSKNVITYESQEEFFEKCSTRGSVNGSPVTLLTLQGNVIVKGDLHFTGLPVVYRGCGTITVPPEIVGTTPKPSNIYISTKIIKGEPTAIMTLNSSWGFVAVTADNLEIQASIVALHPFYSQGKGLCSFMSGPNVSSQGAGSLKIKGNLCVDRLNLPTFPKNTELEYDPLFSELGTEDDYFVSVSTKFTYWVKESL